MHSTTSSQPQHEHPGQALRLSRRAVLQASGGSIATGLAFGAARPGLVAAQSTPASDGGDALTIPLYPHGQELSLDPHRATNWAPHWVMLPHVWAGLMGFDENGAAVPVLASSVEPEEEGRIWVASIRSEATFASGAAVTADALIQGWKRALSPQRTAPLAQYMSRVEGYDAFVAGESEEIGFEARDEATVAIRLSEPYALFREDLATFVWAAVDVAVLDSVSTSQAPFAGASAGMWQFVDSGDEQSIRMEPNPAAMGLPSTFSAVVWRLLEGPQAAEAGLAAYQDGAMPIADVTESLREAVAQDPALEAELQTVPLSGSTMLIGMDYRQSPFDNPRVRQAVAASIDRERWATEIMHGRFTAATSITPPVLAETANYSAPEPVAFDPDAARQLLADAGISDDAMPQVTYYQPAGSTEQELEQASALLMMIQENSGLVIEHDTTLSADQIDALRNDNGGLQFDLRWWWPLTNSPSGLADIGLASSAGMEGWFNWSPDLDQADAAAAAETFATLVTEALVTGDATERTQLFAEAEEILIQNAVYIPLGHWVQDYLQSPALTGTRQGAFTGYVPVAFDESVSYTPTPATPTA